jgi:hypothetical protein
VDGAGAMTPRKTISTDVPSLARSLGASAELMATLLEQFVAQHGKPYDAQVSRMIFNANPYAWPPLNVEGRRLQSKIRSEYKRYFGLLTAALKDESADAGEGSVHSAHTKVSDLIERRPRPDDSDVLGTAIAALQRQLELLDGVHSEHEELILVPDTNALYWNTALEQWRAPSGEPFLIALTPTVIDELDRHKTDRHNERRRLKAARLIRRIGDYRARGVLVDGVPLVKNHSRVFAVAKSANPGEFFDWLGGSADDYFFASAMSVMRQNPRAPTVILTNDVNLQSKIEFARMSFWKPRMVATQEITKVRTS